MNNHQWSSRFGFIMASAGAAIGLGALWKFPYVTGTSGGGAFFLIFIIFTLLIGFPLLISEYIIGRGTGKDAVSAYTVFGCGLADTLLVVGMKVEQDEKSMLLVPPLG